MPESLLLQCQLILAEQIGAMVAAIEGLDAVVFTRGRCENSPKRRDEVCARLGFLGIRLA